MFLTLYQAYRTYVFDSTVCFSIVSGAMFLLFGPRQQYRWLRLWMYLAISAISFSLAFQGVLITLLGGRALIFSNPLRYLYFFFCQVSLSMLWSCLLLRGDAFPKLTYILILVAFMQLYRGVCAPLYDREGAMEQTRYGFLDLATAVGLYACLVGMAVLFKRYKVSSSALLDRRTRIIMLYILVSLLVLMLLPEVVSGFDSSQLVIALVLSDFPLIYYIFGRFTQNLEEQTRMEQALEKARAEWMVYEKSRELRETIREERHELNNNYFHLLVLMREGDTEAVKTELEDRIGSLSKESHRVETGVAYLDHGYGLKIVRKTLDESDGMLSTEVKDFNFTCLDVCPVRIGDNVFIGPNVTLATPMHPLLPEERNAHQRPDGSWHNVEYARPITIGDDCWLASNVVVCGGVTIGEGSVIGAGSVVTKDIPPHSLAVGNPCRVVREITEADRMKQ